METKHTPGPWHSHPEDTYKGVCHSHRNHGCEIHTSHEVNGQIEHFVVANTVVHKSVDEEKSEANAALIAAAPETAQQRDELLKELKLLVGQLDDSLTIQARLLIIEIERVIAKASPSPSRG